MSKVEGYVITICTKEDSFSIEPLASFRVYSARTERNSHEIKIFLPQLKTGEKIIYYIFEKGCLYQLGFYTATTRDDFVVDSIFEMFINKEDNFILEALGSFFKKNEIYFRNFA